MSPKRCNFHHKISHKGLATQLITADINVDHNEAEVLFVGVSQCSPKPVWMGRKSWYSPCRRSELCSLLKVEHQHWEFCLGGFLSFPRLINSFISIWIHGYLFYTGLIIQCYFICCFIPTVPRLSIRRSFLAPMSYHIKNKKHFLTPWCYEPGWAHVLSSYPLPIPESVLSF